MKRYLEHIRTKEPHERRRHALQVAGGITGLFALVWIATLPARLGGATSPQQGESALTAAAAQSQTQNAPYLEVSTSSVYSY